MSDWTGPYNTSETRFRGTIVVTLHLEATPPRDVHVMDWCPGMTAALAAVAALREYPGVHPESVRWSGAQESNDGIVEQPPGQLDLGLVR